MSVSIREPFTREEERADIERFARMTWLGRIESALWRMHKFAEFDSWEERHYYDGLRFIIHFRDKVDAY